MEDMALVRTILVELLSGEPPEKAARLKQRLQREYRQRTGGVFSESVFGYSKFSDFLRANDDLLEVQRPNEPGDVLVIGREDAGSALLPEQRNVSARLPPRLWQAFTNPDPERRRFVERTSGRVIHFIEGSTDPTDKRYSDLVSMSPEAYVEVPFASGEVQCRWMMEFVAELDLPPQRVEPLRRLIDGQFSSSVNHAFTEVLGEHAGRWKHSRALRVTNRASEWAREHGLRVPGLTGPPARPAERGRHGRHYLIELLGRVDENELDGILIPFGLLRRIAERGSIK